MLERIAAVCRVLACGTRLLILREVASERELPAVEIARRVGLVPGLASSHLGRLASAGILVRRRSGRRVYYAFPTREASGEGFSLAGVVSRALREPAWATRGWSEQGLLHLPPAATGVPSDQVARAMDVVFDAATAFTSVRRLQILRLLTQRTACREGEMVGDLRMSPHACRRHMAKLRRRGYVCQQEPGVWGVSGKHRTPFHRALIVEVERALR